MKKIILIIWGVFVIGFSGTSFAKKNDRLGDFLKSNCIISSNNTGKEITSCDPQQVFKDLSVTAGFVVLDVYGDNIKTSYTITASMEVNGYFYEGKIEKNENSYFRKGDLIELPLHNYGNGCVLIDKVINYGSGSIAMKEVGNKGDCTGNRKFAIDNLKGKTLEYKTVLIN